MEWQRRGRCRRSSRLQRLTNNGPALARDHRCPGGIKPLSDKDRADIKKNINDKILFTSINPEITFQSTEVSGIAPDIKVKGNLSLAGKSQPVTLDVRVDESLGRVNGQTTRFGSRASGSNLSRL